MQNGPLESLAQAKSARDGRHGRWPMLATSRETAIPFGPFTIAAALITVFAGGRLADGYLRLGAR